ncbi:patatin-like phospholipase family protein [Oceanobacter mangrovi]|uniref:patatin-like phospholipase family protein n=1 Tax=Oceanobacter mangrovi TaxID=2862510 RepID=UPI001C8D1DE2|nr:patatin-like phospholipase family protein [Oceanobacter mangrovi]
MKTQRTGLILSGGGARAAYQVGVLKAVHEILPKGHYNPFDIISGTSAGAINGIALASYAADYRRGIRQLERIWRHFTPDQIYRTDFWGISSSLARVSRSLFFGRRGTSDPASLLDNSPLRELLEEVTNFERLQQAIDDQHLYAIAVNCSGVDSGESTAFFQGHPEIENWQRQRRVGVRSLLSIDHLMASSAIPMIFPSVFLGDQFYADGAVRQLAPISPALHLGAEKVMVIGVSAITHRNKPAIPNTRYPTPAKMMGHMLNAAFLDSMESDIERLQRINRTLQHIPRSVRQHYDMELKPIQLLEISPSRSLDELAGEHADEVPKALRLVINGNTNSRSNGSGILSYLLFSEGYCRRLICLGFDDAMAKAAEIRDFFRDHFDDSQLS